MVSSSEASKSFGLFSKLPSEIRDKIWGHAMEDKHEMHYLQLMWGLHHYDFSANPPPDGMDLYGRDKGWECSPVFFPGTRKATSQDKQPRESNHGYGKCIGDACGEALQVARRERRLGDLVQIPVLSPSRYTLETRQDTHPWGDKVIMAPAEKGLAEYRRSWSKLCLNPASDLLCLQISNLPWNYTIDLPGLPSIYPQLVAVNRERPDLKLLDRFLPQLGVLDQVYPQLKALEQVAFDFADVPNNAWLLSSGTIVSYPRLETLAVTICRHLSGVKTVYLIDWVLHLRQGQVYDHKFSNGQHNFYEVDDGDTTGWRDDVFQCAKAVEVACKEAWDEYKNFMATCKELRASAKYYPPVNNKLGPRKFECRVLAAVLVRPEKASEENEPAQVPMSQEDRQQKRICGMQSVSVPLSELAQWA